MGSKRVTKLITGLCSIRNSIHKPPKTIDRSICETIAKDLLSHFPALHDYPSTTPFNTPKEPETKKFIPPRSRENLETPKSDDQKEKGV